MKIVTLQPHPPPVRTYRETADGCHCTIALWQTVKEKSLMFCLLEIHSFSFCMSLRFGENCFLLFMPWTLDLVETLHSMYYGDSAMGNWTTSAPKWLCYGWALIIMVTPQNRSVKASWLSSMWSIRSCPKLTPLYWGCCREVRIQTHFVSVMRAWTL